MESITFHTDLPLRAQTAYAQLYDAALVAEYLRSIADLKGSFNAKTVKGAKYWYYQYKEPSGKLHQVYVGPDNDAVAALSRLAERTSSSIVFTFAPRTPLLGAMISVGRLFPRGDRAPWLNPMAADTLEAMRAQDPVLSRWQAGRTERVSSGFYKSQAMEWTGA